MGLLDNGFGTSDDTSGQPAASSPASYYGLLGDSPLQASYGGSLSQDTINSLNRQRAINSLLGFFAAAGNAGQPSRLPIPTGVAMARGVGGQLEAQRDFDQTAARNLLLGPQYQAMQLENQGRGINNALGLMNLRGWQGILGSGGAPGSGVAPSLLAPPPASGSLGAPQAMPVSATPGASAPGANAPTGSPPLLTGSGAPPSTGLGGGPPASSGSSASSASASGPVPILDPASLIARAQQYARFPAGLTTANQLFSMAQKMMPEGTVLMSDGSVALPKGADQAMMTRALADKGFIRGADGLFHIDPGYVAGQAQLTSAQEWAKVAPQLYEKRNEPFSLSRPGELRIDPSTGRVIGQTPVPLEGVNPDGTPYKEYRYLYGNPGPTTSNLLGGPPATSAAPPPSTLSGDASSSAPIPLAFKAALPPGAGGSLLATPPSAQGTSGTAAPPTPAGVNEQGLPRVQAGLSPLAKTSAESRGKALEELGAEVETNANNAVQNNALIDQMRNESASWQMGKFADFKNDALAYLQGFGKTFNLDTSGIDQRVGDFQAFNKNGMELVRQAVRSTSSRAAVQEFTMIQQALPNAEMSQQGFGQIADQLQSFNDFHIAKQQAAQLWRQGHNGTLDGFNADWNAKMSPSAFLMHRLAATNPDALQTVVSRMAQSSEGVAYLKRLQGELQYGKQAGLFGE